jgi:hypothetical protein
MSTKTVKPLISILTPKLVNCPSFTVDNSATEVPIVLPGALMPLENVVYTKFREWENVQLLSFGVWLPYHYVFAEQTGTYGCFQGYITFRDTLGNIPGPIWDFNLPMENCEMSINFFLDGIADTGGSAKVELVMALTKYPIPGGDAYISMIGSPDSMNTRELHVIPFVKVAHTIEMLS